MQCNGSCPIQSRLHASCRRSPGQTLAALGKIVDEIVQAVSVLLDIGRLDPVQLPSDLYGCEFAVVAAADEVFDHSREEDVVLPEGGFDVEKQLDLLSAAEQYI